VIALEAAGADSVSAKICGPSIPAMLGVQDSPKVVDQKLVLLEASGDYLVIDLVAGTGGASLEAVPLPASRSSALRRLRRSTSRSRRASAGCR